VKYWDSSALAALCLKQPASPQLQAITALDNEVAVWWGTLVETESAIARLRRFGELDAQSEMTAREHFERIFLLANEIAPFEDTRTLACRLVRLHPLRAADALQLAAALVWAEHQPRGLGFVCLNDRLRDAAYREGFEVLPLS
jgi:hypothetical protein